MESPRKLKDWQIAWGIGFSLVGVMCAVVFGAAFVAGDIWMALAYFLLAAPCTVGALVAFTPIKRTKKAPGTEHPYCTGCGDRHGGPRCYS